MTRTKTATMSWRVNDRRVGDAAAGGDRAAADDGAEKVPTATVASFLSKGKWGALAQVRGVGQLTTIGNEVNSSGRGRLTTYKQQMSEPRGAAGTAGAYEDADDQFCSAGRSVPSNPVEPSNRRRCDSWLPAAVIDRSSWCVVRAHRCRGERDWSARRIRSRRARQSPWRSRPHIRSRSCAPPS
jgi:hypothetical protein